VLTRTEVVVECENGRDRRDTRRQIDVRRHIHKKISQQVRAVMSEDRGERKKTGGGRGEGDEGDEEDTEADELRPGSTACGGRVSLYREFGEMGSVTKDGTDEHRSR
jgi:hypothetical protein